MQLIVMILIWKPSNPIFVKYFDEVRLQCPIFARMHQTLNRLANRAKTMLNANPPVAHHLSQIQRIYQMFNKHPQNGSSKGISTLKLAAGQQGKLMKKQFWQLWRSNIYQLFLFLPIAWKVFTM